jgi:hypothetical protein
MVLNLNINIGDGPFSAEKVAIDANKLVPAESEIAHKLPAQITIRISDKEPTIRFSRSKSEIIMPTQYYKRLIPEEKMSAIARWLFIYANQDELINIEFQRRANLTQHFGKLYSAAAAGIILDAVFSVPTAVLGWIALGAAVGAHIMRYMTDCARLNVLQAADNYSLKVYPDSQANLSSLKKEAMFSTKNNFIFTRVEAFKNKTDPWVAHPMPAH